MEHRLRDLQRLLPVGVLLVACATPGAHRADRPMASPPAGSGASSAAGATAAPSPIAQLLAAPRWSSRLSASHPLVGRVWAPGAARFVDPEEAAEDVRRADLVLLGERHDNADHQRLHVAWLQTVASAGRRPTLVLEMLDTERQPAIDASRAAARAEDPDAFARAIGWEGSGWPWARYRGVVAAALELGLPLRAGNQPREASRRLVREGAAALTEVERVRLGLDRALGADESASLRAEMRESHCGMLPEGLLDGMGLAQRARDGEMASAMLAAGQGGAVLVAGAGHVRRDRGVPAVLARAAPARTLRAVAYLEVRDDAPEPASYAGAFDAAALPFDYVVFTPRDNDEDPCASLRAPAAPPGPASPAP